MPAALHRQAARSAHCADGGWCRRSPCRAQALCAGIGHRARGMPGVHGARLQESPVPGVRPDSELFRVAAGCGSHLDLSVRAPRAQAAAMGISRQAVAAEVSHAPAVSRAPGPRIPGCAFRDDPPRSHRRHSLGDAVVCRLCGQAHRQGGPALPGQAQRAALVNRHGASAGVSRQRQRGALLRHSFPRDAARSRRRSARLV